jgi:BirA family biotin operon repressor/biotin-[acetyl-CoA-carboxylase] ligase
LLGGRKVAGILVETVWSGDEADSLVIGMGINVGRSSVPPAESLRFPATSLEDELGRALSREEIIFLVLEAIQKRGREIGAERFIRSWEERLAFRGETVQVSAENEASVCGVLEGLELDGGLRLRDEHDKTVSVHIGDVSLRPSA